MPMPIPIPIPIPIHIHIHIHMHMHMHACIHGRILDVCNYACINIYDPGSRLFDPPPLPMVPPTPSAHTHAQPCRNPLNVHCSHMAAPKPSTVRGPGEGRHPQADPNAEPMMMMPHTPGVPKSRTTPHYKGGESHSKQTQTPTTPHQSGGSEAPPNREVRGYQP